MLSIEILDEEILFRAIPNSPDFWKDKERRYSSAIFKQSGGTSVDRDGGRSSSDMVSVFASRMPGYGLVSISAQKCRECGGYPVSKPIKAEPDKGIEANEYHAEIHDSQSKIEIRNSKGKNLRDNSEVLVLTEIALKSLGLWNEEKGT